MKASSSESVRPALERMQCMEIRGGNSQADNSLIVPGLNVWVYCKPFGGSSSGGDVYYVSSCASGRITRVLLADVSGHGSGVSKLASGLRDLMRRNVNVVKQTRFVEGMNRQFLELSESGSFATALVATYFQPTRRLTLCSAGHPAPLLYDASRRAWSYVEQPVLESEAITGTPLGVHDEARYPQIERRLERGDLVLLYSDALTESMGLDGQLLGTAGLLRLIRGIDSGEPAEIVPRLLETLQSLHPDNLHGDDVTILLLESVATSTRLIDNLLALFRLLRGVRDRSNWQPGVEI